ncbi:uncharacterized protein NPIL_602381 [Nephila pilipes]|uniref:Gustatory receptor n=1 Tax=Nephila pilipes TaxID=299642 RepID=A0A8X6PRY1_NEPPI|nr:uncharacterized protein NPIL_602381 [Nephila pilipes]
MQYHLIANEMNEDRLRYGAASRRQNHDWCFKYTNKPNTLLRLICWMGFLADSDDTQRGRIASRVFLVTIIMSGIDRTIAYFLEDNLEKMWKVVAIIISNYFVSVLIKYAMIRKRKDLTRFLRLLHKIHPHTQRKEVDIILYCIFSIPIIFAVLNVFSAERGKMANLLSYHYPIHNPLLQILLILVKTSLYNTLHPMFPTLVVLLHCVLCHRVGGLINRLKKEVVRCPSAEFTLSKQVSLLKQKNKIDDALVLLQQVLYLPSFLICMLYFCACCNAVGWLVVGEKNTADAALMVQFALYLANAIFSLLAYMWFVGCLPTEMDAFKDEFCRKVQEKLLVGGKPDDIDYQKGLCERPSFVLSGCDIIHFKRSSILSLSGAVFTYTILLITN